VRASGVTKRMGGDAKMMFIAFMAAMFSGGGAQDWT
jgi:hypothetical protein